MSGCPSLAVWKALAETVGSFGGTLVYQCGLTHERALPGLADRLLSCLVATLHDGVSYDPERRQASLTRGAAA